MKYLAITALFLVSTIAAQTVRADDDPYNRSGGYIGVGGSYALPLSGNSFDDAFKPLNADVSRSWGAHATAGYRFNKWLATEVEYEWMKGFNTRAAGIAVADIQTQTATVNLKVTAPYGQWQPYFLVGGGATWASLDKDFFNNLDVTTPSFTARFGAGLDFYFTPNFYLNIGTDVLVNTAKINAGIPGQSGRGLDHLAGQFGFGYRF